MNYILKMLTDGKTYERHFERDNKFTVKMIESPSDLVYLLVQRIFVHNPNLLTAMYIDLVASHEITLTGHGERSQNL